MFAFWWRRSFWDTAELLFAAMTALAGASATSLAAFPSVPAGWRVGSASATFLFASAVAGCKWRAKVLDDREKLAARAESQALRDRAASQVRRAIVRLLDGLRQEFFRVGEEDTPRATLFVCCAAQPEANLGKRLCIYARAGVYPDSDRTWAIDDNDVTGCRGLAGYVWFVRRTEFRTATCDWPADGNAEQKEEYAKSLHMAVEEADGLHVKVRKLIGTPIEVNGVIWGVLVLDCCKAVAIHASPTSTQRRLLNLSAAIISSISREAEL
jgi:hypothetical protein